MNECVQEKGKRVYYHIAIEKIDLDDFSLIDNKIRCAKEALDIHVLPHDISAEVITAYTKAAIEAKAEAEFLHQNWWSRMLEKYDLAKDKLVYLDISAKDFYLLEEINE